MALGYGVMVTLQILVLSFQVRILVAQQKNAVERTAFFICIGLLLQLIFLHTLLRHYNGQDIAILVETHLLDTGHAVIALI